LPRGSSSGRWSKSSRPAWRFSDRVLELKQNNYLASIAIASPLSTGTDLAGFAYLDVTTAEFRAAEFPLRSLAEQVSSVGPAEIIVQKRDLETIRGLLAGVFTGLYSTLDDWVYTEEYARELLTGQFKTQSLKGFGLEERSLAVIAAGAAMHYLRETQKSNLLHIRRITPYDVGDHIVLDPSTKRNLEISSSSTGSTDGTLFGVLDRTLTPMGGRLLKQWVTNPLNNVAPILRRLDAVEEFTRTPPPPLGRDRDSGPDRRPGTPQYACVHRPRDAKGDDRAQTDARGRHGDACGRRRGRGRRAL
jgi:DNA mismatch repair protein MutS